MTHYIKILPEYFNAVATGRKSFEVRCNDRKYTVGDRLIMQEVDEHGRLSGQSIVCKITYIFSDTEYVKEGYVVLSVVFIRKNPLTTLEVWAETGEEYYAVYGADGKDICESLCRHSEDKTAEHCDGCLLRQLINRLGDIEYWGNLSRGEDDE